MSNTLVDVFDETIATFFTRTYIYIYMYTLTGASMCLLEDTVTHNSKHLSVIVGRLIYYWSRRIWRKLIKNRLIVGYRLMTKPNNTDPDINFGVHPLTNMWCANRLGGDVAGHSSWSRRNVAAFIFFAWPSPCPWIFSYTTWTMCTFLIYIFLQFLFINFIK